MPTKYGGNFYFSFFLKMSFSYYKIRLNSPRKHGMIYSNTKYKMQDFIFNHSLF